MTIALATSSAYRDLDTDLPLLTETAHAVGVECEIAIWDDPAVDWSSYDAVVVRSCWDYMSRRDEFLAWAASVPNLHNPAAVLAWNTDKAYLRQLADAGVPIIPTIWDVVAGDDLGDHAEWVVKPSISAGSRDTARWTSPDDVYAHSADLIAAGRTSMVQPYIASVDDEGETALLYIRGTFSHAIRKGALLLPGEGIQQDRDSREEISAREPTATQRKVADAALAAAAIIQPSAADLLYARVDVVTGPDGAPLVIELELTEPSLFLHTSAHAPARLIAAAAALARP